jgi:predicted phage-related endonuclease
MAAKNPAPTVRIVDDRGLDEGIALNAVAQRALSKLRTVLEAQAQLANQRKILEDKIKAALGDAELGTIRGVPQVSWKTAIVESISPTMLRKKYPDIARECSQMTTRRTFKILDTP